MPIYLIQRTVPCSEIRLWEAKYNSRFSVHEKIDYYLAAIRMEVLRASLTKGRGLRIEDFLLKFGEPETMSDEQADARVKAWAMAMCTASSEKRKRS